MPDITNAITNTISISLFNRGLAGKVFEDVKKCGAKVVMKNNAPECVLLSPEEYIKLMDEINDARLLTLASERMANYDISKTVSEDDVMKELGITADELANAAQRLRKHGL
jgi:PHD/YefM family antitoxin component YafN of YafNO toxin-antitoxin module